MRRVGSDDRAPLPAFTAVGEVGAHQHQAGELALRARGGLERDGVEAADLRQDLLEAPHQLERALRPFLLLQRMEIAEPGSATTLSLTRGLCFIVQEPSG